MTQKEELVNWLNDAYSMEITNAKILEGHIKDMSEFPDIQSRLKQHLGETRMHAQRLNDCITEIGEKVSSTKKGLGNVMGILKGRSSSVFQDDVVKDVLSESATEHFEVACYKSLIAAAEEMNQPRVMQICRENMGEDQAMADWVDSQVPLVTRRFMETRLSAG
jgi:ferritin-like metal-binding protein YciE